MRILYCIPHLFNSGGMERVLTQKVNWLAAHTEYEITVITTEQTPEGMSDTCFALDKRVQVVALNIDFNADYTKPLFSKWCGHIRRMRVYRKALTDYIRTHCIDLCISLGGKEIAFLRTMPCRTIAEMHFSKDQRRQLLMANHQGVFWSFLGRIRTWQLVHAVKSLERLVVLTEEDKKAWQKAGCTNVICISNPCIFDGQVIPQVEKQKILLAVGRLHEQKGFDLLLQAWQKIERNYPQWTLRIVGEGEQRELLMRQIRQVGLQHVQMAGRSSDIIKEYAQASLFVLSSRYEGLPLALIEAMWCGVPCIAFDCPYGPGTLLAEDRGWLVPDGDISALAEQLAYAITHPQEAIQRAQTAQIFAQQTYSEPVIMPKWIDVIEK